MFQFTAKFLQPTTATTVMPNVPTKPTTTTNNHLHSQLLLERQRRGNMQHK